MRRLNTLCLVSATIGDKHAQACRGFLSTSHQHSQFTKCINLLQYNEAISTLRPAEINKLYLHLLTHPELPSDSFLSLPKRSGLAGTEPSNAAAHLLWRKVLHLSRTRNLHHVVLTSEGLRVAVSKLHCVCGGDQYWLVHGSNHKLKFTSLLHVQVSGAEPGTRNPHSSASLPRHIEPRQQDKSSTARAPESPGGEQKRNPWYKQINVGHWELQDC